MGNLNNFIGIIIKPDSLKLGLENSIKEDILKDQFRIRFEKIMQITSEQVPYVYRDKINTNRYPYSHYSVTHWKSIVLLLEWENCYNRFSKLKWSAHCNWWIREKYRKYNKEMLIEMWLSWPALEYQLCQNIIHGCELPEETILMLSWLLNRKEINEISSFSYLLYTNILKKLTNIKWI